MAASAAVMTMATMLIEMAFKFGSFGWLTLLGRLLSM